MSTSQSTPAQDESIRYSQESHSRDRVASARSRCLDIDCPYFDADSIPNHAIVVDTISDEDMSHIKDFHQSC